MSALALLLLAPWLLVLGWAYWYFPRTPRRGARRAFDATALLLAAAATVALALYSFHSHAGAGRHVDALGRHSGAIWQQVLPALLGYAAFVAVLLLALVVRTLLFRRR